MINAEPAGVIYRVVREHVPESGRARGAFGHYRGVVRSHITGVVYQAVRHGVVIALDINAAAGALKDISQLL
jgi:hypothetical protein